METKILYLWERIRNNFWFVPAVMVLFSILFAVILLFLDYNLSFEFSGIFSPFSLMSLDGARSILSVIASSMITVASLVFSITMVVLTLASSQFGPHLLRNYMLDTGNQVTLGTFIATFIYCLFVLQSVHEQEHSLFIPTFSILFAILLALVNVGVLIYFIHHTSVSIQADHILAAVSNTLQADIERLFGPELSEDKANENTGNQAKKTGPERAKIEQAVSKYRYHMPVRALKSGYLQSLDTEGLTNIATEHNLLIHLKYRPGTFVVKDNPIAMIRYHKKPDPMEAFNQKISRTFYLGPQRIPAQDIEFAIHQLVEVAVRSLSPGINDPYTAMGCVDWLTSAICSLTKRDFPSAYHYNDQGRLCLVSRPLTFSGVLNSSFDQIRQYGSTSVAITLRLLENLETIAFYTRNTEQREAVARQARMIEQGSHQGLPEEEDRNEVRERYLFLLKALQN